MPRLAYASQPIYIPEGHYYTKAQAAEHFAVLVGTVQQWIDKDWLPVIAVPGLGYLIDERTVLEFTPPGRGRKAGS